MSTLVLNDEHIGPKEINPTTLLVFMDETGEESLSDPNAPFFGVGGLIVECRQYFESIENPWHLVKDEMFGGRNNPLHASDLRNPSTEQIDSLNTFFSNDTFGRFATTCTDKSIFELDVKIEDVIMTTIWDRIKEVANKLSWFDILVIFEENERLVQSFKKEVMSKTLHNSKGEKIEVSYNLMKKDPYFAGMEVADFIVHTAGRQSRIMRNHHFDMTGIASQPDFEIVFSKSKLQSYMSISRVRDKTEA